MLDALGRPQDRLRFVHVAGTNGKGSTCAMIASALRAAGRRTGLFTSPHLAEPTERIRIDGRPISAERFAAAFDRVHAVVERLLSAGTIDLHTTYFETVTAMALLVFAEEAVEMVVLEVGLGGRLDATNVVMPDLCVITPIDFDHEAFLGRSLEAIAGEKAGILKPGVPAVFARQRREAARCWICAPHSSRFRWRGRKRGASTIWNWMHAAADFYSAANSICGSRARWPASTRWRMPHRRRGAHAAGDFRIRHPCRDRTNSVARTIGARVRASRDHPRWRPQSRRGARAGGIYRALLCGRRVRLIYGAMRDKAVDEIGEILFPLAQQVIVTAPRQARALAPESIRQVSAITISARQPIWARRSRW